MSAIATLARALLVLAGFVVALTAGQAFADDLCGRPREAPEALLERLIKTEKLPEIHRDKAYVALHDKARGTTWTFTVAGHPAHPSAVCRRPMRDGERLRIEMNVSCGAAEAECEKLVGAFQELNDQMLQEMQKQPRK